MVSRGVKIVVHSDIEKEDRLLRQAGVLFNPPTSDEYPSFTHPVSVTTKLSIIQTQIPNFHLFAAL